MIVSRNESTLISRGVAVMLLAALLRPAGFLQQSSHPQEDPWLRQDSPLASPSSPGEALDSPSSPALPSSMTPLQLSAFVHELQGRVWEQSPESRQALKLSDRESLQITSLPPILSDGQFVWGPNVGDFNAGEYLLGINSPLAPYSDAIANWARYTSINPRVFLTYLELTYGLVRSDTLNVNPVDIGRIIEKSAMDLALSFYQHLYTWGTRGNRNQADVNGLSPAILFSDGSNAVIESRIPSGTYALTFMLAKAFDSETWSARMDSTQEDSFTGVFGALFPGIDPLDSSNNINPTALPQSIFQLPFPLEATWRFSGIHSWFGGGDYPDRSSIDFSYPWSDFPLPPYRNAVAAGEGEGFVYIPYEGEQPCWVRVDHGDGWWTSYYHLIETASPGPIGAIGRNQVIGAIGESVCNGGFATGPHVHFTLWYNGALADLDGIKLSGWTVHPDHSCTDNCYSAGFLERDGIVLSPWSWLENDYEEYFPGTETSLRFFGNGYGDIDRVKIELDAPNRPIDVGATDFTVEFWLKAKSGENISSACIESGDRWRFGNVILDRDIYGTGDYGDYGISLSNGRIAFGVNNGYSGKTICSTTTVADDIWHHIAVSHSFTNGMMRIFVDGALERQEDGPNGNISYRNQRTSGYPNDPYLVVGAEKHDLGPSYPSYSGYLDELRISDSLRYISNFTPAFSPFETDEHTVALYHFNEGTGDVILDTSGVVGGPSNGIRLFGGSPAGPVWEQASPFSVKSQNLLKYRSPAVVELGTSNEQWFIKAAPSSEVERGSDFQYIIWLQVPADWQLPWGRQYSYDQAFSNATLTKDSGAQNWMVTSVDCLPYSGYAETGYKWRAWHGPLETLPYYGAPTSHEVSLRGGLQIPESADLGAYRIAVISGVFYDSDGDLAPDTYACTGSGHSIITVAPGP